MLILDCTQNFHYIVQSKSHLCIVPFNWNGFQCWEVLCICREECFVGKQESSVSCRFWLWERAFVKGGSLEMNGFEYGLKTVCFRVLNVANSVNGRLTDIGSVPNPECKKN